MKLSLLAILVCLASSVSAQNVVKKDTTQKHPSIQWAKDPGSDMNTNITPAGAAPQPDKVFMYVEQMPTQSYDLNKYLQEHVKYPNEAKENNVEGRVIVQFVVNQDGTFSDVKVVRGIGAGCDEEAIRVVKSMPPWNAAKQGGNKVRCAYSLPVVFKLMAGK